MEKTASGLSANQIKWIAVAAMAIDHAAWVFVPTYSALGQGMPLFGRITAPVMCFFLSEGYAHTRSKGRYALRLALFALISQAPFVFFETGKFQFFPDSLFAGGDPSESLNVIYTLFLSLLAIWAWDSIRSGTLRALAILALCILAIPGDWTFCDVIFSVLFWIYRGNLRLQMKWFAVSAACVVILFSAESALAGQPFGQLFQAGLFLCIPLLLCYNGKRGGGTGSKWAFYVFYPAHLAAVRGLSFLI